MGAHIIGIGNVDPARWERTDPERPDRITVKEGDSRFTLEARAWGYGVSHQMSYGRWADLGDDIIRWRDFLRVCDGYGWD